MWFPRLLSDGYKRIDHLDTLTAVFAGIRQSGQDVTIDSCDLTERRMHVRVRCPAMQVLAPALLSDYRSPFDGACLAEHVVGTSGVSLDLGAAATGSPETRSSSTRSRNWASARLCGSPRTALAATG